MPLKTLDDGENLLYDALAVIGEAERTIHWPVLETYSVLLASPKVIRRAGVGATNTQLARAAQDVLCAEIDSFAVKADKLLAEAVLAADRDSSRLFKFEGKPVGQRKLFLESHASPIHISLNQYRRGRERILKRIARNLRCHAPATSPRSIPTQTEAASSENPPIPYIRDLGEKAAHLHFAALSRLFLLDTASELSAAGLIAKPYSDEDINCRIMYEGYRACALEAKPDVAAYTPTLPNTASESLVDIIMRLRSCGPFDAAKLQAINEAYEAPRIDGATVDWLTRLYDHWMWWYLSRSDQQRRQLSCISTTSSNIARLIGEHIGYEVPIFQFARGAAHKRIALYFSFDEWQPLVNGQSLHTLTDLYFDQHSVVDKDLSLSHSN